VVMFVVSTAKVYVPVAGVGIETISTLFNRSRCPG